MNLGVEVVVPQGYRKFDILRSLLCFEHTLRVHFSYYLYYYIYSTIRYVISVCLSVLLFLESCNSDWAEILHRSCNHKAQRSNWDGVFCMHIYLEISIIHNCEWSCAKIMFYVFHLYVALYSRAGQHDDPFVHTVLTLYPFLAGTHS